MRRRAALRDAALSALALVGAVPVIARMVHVCADIAMRNIWNRPIPATHEVVVNCDMVALAFVLLAWVERSGAMIQVEVINGALSPLMMRISDVLVALISALIHATLAWVTWQVAVRQTAVGGFVTANQIRVPVWPACWLPPAGFALAAVAAALKLPALLIPARRA
jgi:TRAP-type C4-dicarboxylate transport system permease small subunit